MENNPLHILESDFKAISGEVINQFKDGKYDEYLISSEGILTKNPSNTGALLYKGIILQERKQYQEALECFDKVTELCPLFPYTWFYKGECRLNIKDYDLALDSFKEILRLLPKHTLSWCYSALCFFMKGKESVAIGLLEHAYNEVDDKPQISLARGIIEEKSGKNDDALISYMQSQLLANDKDKGVTAFRIHDLLS